MIEVHCTFSYRCVLCSTSIEEIKFHMSKNSVVSFVNCLIFLITVLFEQLVRSHSDTYW